MPFLSRLFSALTVLAVLPVVIWFCRYSRWSEATYREAAAQAARNDLAERRRIAAEEQIRESNKPKPPAHSWRPEIATEPPFPKVEVKEAVFDFGTVRLGEMKKHFVCIKNTGDAPLVLAKPPVLHSPPWERAVKVGEAFDYEMHWNAREPGTQFAQTETLFTNDPQRPLIEMKVSGRVAGPVARVAIEEPIFDFGTAQVGQPMRHVFHIRNVGDAPLEFRPAPVCEHAIPPSGAGWRQLLRAGETFDLEMKWTAHEAPPNFAIGANFLTNDPNSPLVSVKIRGKITDPNRPTFDWQEIPIVP